MWFVGIGRALRIYIYIYIYIYNGSAGRFVGQVGHCGFIYWEFLWFVGTRRALRKHILGVRVLWLKR